MSDTSSNDRKPTHHAHRFGHERHEQAIDDEAGRIAARDHRLADLLAKRDQRSSRRFARLCGRHDLRVSIVVVQQIKSLLITIVKSNGIQTLVFLPRRVSSPVLG